MKTKHLITGGLFTLGVMIPLLGWFALQPSADLTTSVSASQPVVLQIDERSNDKLAPIWKGDYYNLGSFEQKVSAKTPEGKTWFQRGLVMCYGFNHEEAIRCFEKAIQAEPDMPMAYWGLAYAMGPNINNLEISTDQIAQAAQLLKLAQLHLDRTSEIEKQLILALSKRYQVPAPAVDQRAASNKDYAESMRSLYQNHQDNALVSALFAESLMILRPWNHWSKEGEPAAETPEIVAVLERSLKQWPDHPALCHYYIHAMEASPTPEVALPAANRLRQRIPGSGHLVHMPSHIDVLVGDYKNVIRTNQLAIQADSVFLEQAGADNFYTFYRLHNYHFLVYGAMFDGQCDLAEKAAQDLVGQIPETLLKEQTDFLDAFVPTIVHVKVRFGKWEDILQLPEYPDYLPTSRSIRHYARGLAYAATGRVEQAREEQKQFLAARQQVPETSILFNNTSLQILSVAEAMLEGEIAYREGNFEEAFEQLREAVRRDDALNYDEPWGWMQPTRHALGGLLLEQGHHEEAIDVFRADLKRRPKNPWALRGLANALRGDGQETAAQEVEQLYQSACERSDVKIDRACFCQTMDQ